MEQRKRPYENEEDEKKTTTALSTDQNETTTITTTSISNREEIIKRRRCRNVMPEHSYTYTDGFSFKSIEGITTLVVARICRDLAKGLGTGYVVHPEPITEGGLVVTMWPGKGLGQYKSLRFRVPNGGGHDEFGKWPFVGDPGAVYEEWLVSPAKMIWCGSTQTHGTFLKAFHGAPCWTTEEVKMVAEVFGANGLEVTKTSLRKLTTKRLTDHGDLGCLVMRGSSSSQ